jgi:organic hydroperoxide reductase OsmC/OhrA
MPIAPFPHHYSVTLSDDQITAAPRAAIRMGPPPQFSGSDEVWSPEHLLMAAVLSCVKTTFDAYARRERVPIHQWRGSATGVLAKTREGPVFTAIDLEIEITTESGDEARAQAVLTAAERDCIVSRALSAPVHVVGKVTSSPNRVAG